MSAQQREIDEDWQASVDDFSFFGKLWSDYVPVYEVIPVDPQVMQDYMDAPTDDEPQPTVNAYDPLDEADDLTRDIITSFRSWGQGPVLAAMQKLGLSEVTNQDTGNQVLDWLSSNYDDIFEPDPDVLFADMPEIEEYEYTPVEMDITYEPKYSDADKTIKRAYESYEGNEPFKENVGPNINLDTYIKMPSTNSLYD